MPRPKLKLSAAEAELYSRRFSRLKEMGVAGGCDGDFLCEVPGQVREDFELQQIDHVLAQVHDLSGGLVVMLHAKLLVHAGATLITRSEMAIPWYPLALDLDDPEDSPFYQDVILGTIPFPPTLLNPYLTGKLPLRHCQVDGVIIAMGSLSAPSSIPERTNVPVELVLWDEWENEFCFNFEAQLSRTLKVVRERREQANRPACHGREPLFKREDGQVGNQVGVSLEEAIERPHASHEQDATGDSRTPTTK